jgi:hypothetical protein
MRSRVRLASCSALLFGAVATGCRSRPAPVPYPFVVRVTGDPGKPLAGAIVSRGRVEVARTGLDGVATFDVQGAEGETIAMDVACPQGYKSPSDAVPVRLRRLSDPKQRAEYDVSCPPNIRKIVVAVRANNGKNLPVVYLGQELARTDSSGAAHVELDAAPDDTIELTLSTDEKGNERLKPQNPSAKFIVKNQDEVFVFSTDFVVEAEKHAPVAARPKTPTGPTRIPTLASKLR